jgi:hypothetical protein
MEKAELLTAMACSGNTMLSEKGFPGYPRRLGWLRVQGYALSSHEGKRSRDPLEPNVSENFELV